MSLSGCPDEVLLPDEIAMEDGRLGWVSQEAMPDPGTAILRVAHELGLDAIKLRAVPVLVREESEVEAKINGHEFPLWVECTKRARSHFAFWRIEEAL